MVVGLFRQNQPAVLVGLLPLAILLWPGGPFSSPEILGSLPHGMPLYRPIAWLMAQNVWACATVSIIWVAGLALQLTYVANESELFERRNYLPALLLPILLGLAPGGLVPDPAMVGMPFVLAALRRIWGSQADHRALGPVFDAGLWIGLATLVYLPYAFLVAVLWASIAVMRPFHWREYLLPLLGVAIVLFLCWGVLQFLDPNSWHVKGSLDIRAAPLSSLARLHWVYGVLLVVLGAIFIVSAAMSFARGYARGVMREKNTRSSFLAFTFACALLVAFGWMLHSSLTPVLWALPLSVFLSWPLLQTRRMLLANLGVMALLLLAVWARWW
jgi:hypothetical protein